MSYSNWQKGSQWRKWDLHVHTPASFHWKGGNNLSEMSEEEKTKSFNELLETIENSDVAVFCFTDYWTFDGYVQLKRYLEQNKIDCSKTIFPGMELRVEAPVDYRLNMQVVLSNLLTEQNLEDFKSKLNIRSINRQISNESIKGFAKTLDKSKAKVHGFDDPKNLSESDLLRLGSSTIEITKESLADAIKSVPPGSVYIIMPYDTSDGLLKLDWKTQPHADNYFMQTAHVFESRKDETVKLFLGIETDQNQAILANFQKTLGNTQKPVVCGSDAHRYSDYGKYPGGKATWIKADPTFQGFRQIIFDPRERVQIQEVQPYEKIPYRVIDKVRFVDNTGKNFFSSEWIHLNENLNTIIGGKSSGKSLLLYHIAKTIDSNLIEQRSKEVPILDYSFEPLDHFDFEVAWKDGHIDRLSSTSSESVREIEYIPQLYVNALAEKDGKVSLYKLIEDILRQNIEYREFIEEVRRDVGDLEIKIDSDVAELLRRREELQALQEERKAIGVIESINEEINRLNSKIEQLSQDSSFTEDERKEFERLSHLRVEQNQKKKKYDELGNSLISSSSSLEQIKNRTIQSVENPSSMLGLDSYAKRILKFLMSSLIVSLNLTFDTAILTQKSLVQNAQNKAFKCTEKEKKILEAIKPYTDKIKDQAQLKEYNTKLKEQQDILTAYNEKTSLIESVKAIGIEVRNQLFENYSRLFELHKNIIAKLGDEKYSKIDNDIFLEASLKFDAERFSASFGNLFNRRSSNFGYIFGDAINDKDEFQFEEALHVQRITEVFKKLSTKSNTEIVFRKNLSQADAITQLFKNYFMVEYNIRYRNDEILDMSPGKRGLVLLQLILHISNATHPILIDQPEDNLDNRTISIELRQFVSTKKLARQIIMVTHDANLVVLTDAENVIVSNQDGQQINRENAAFRFEYIAGALENSYRADNSEEGQGVLLSCGIREHVCDVLEGGELAFKKREEKYGFSNR